MAKKTAVPIRQLIKIPRIFYVDCRSCDAEYLARVFRDVWDEIPPEARDIIAKYTHPFGIQVESYGLGSWAGCCQHHGRKIVLNDALVNWNPEAVLRETVAHELAHVVDHAKQAAKRAGKFMQCDDPEIMPHFKALDDQPKAYQNRERRVKNLVKRWGFECSKWCRLSADDEIRVKATAEKEKAYLETLPPERRRLWDPNSLKC